MSTRKLLEEWREIGYNGAACTLNIQCVTLGIMRNGLKNYNNTKVSKFMSERLTIYDPDDHKPITRTLMLFLGLVVGLIAGLGSVLFRYMIGLVHNIAFLGQFSMAYDANVHTPASPFGAWIILVPVIGAVIVAWMVGNFAPEAKGHGVPEVMDAIYYKNGVIRGMVGIVKSLASAISIGTGGSAGREGPFVQIGSAFGSVLGQWVSMPARQRCILIAAGASAGIAATFNTPLGAVAFGMELMLVSVSAETLVPVALSVVMATWLSRFFLGDTPAFNIPALQVLNFHLIDPVCLGVFLVFGVIVGLASLLFVRGIYWFEDIFEAMPGNYYTQHMFGMLLMGLLMYGFLRMTGNYYVEGVGYAAIVDILIGLLHHPIFLLVLFFAKFLATGLTIGSGASGGIFSPSLFMGATLGAAVGYVAQMILPGFGLNPLLFAIAGMAGMVGGSTGAILTAIIMTSEMTKDPNIILPVMITAVVAYAIRKYFSRESIYTLKILRRGNVLPEGLQAAITSAQEAQHIMRKSFRVISMTELKTNPKQYFQEKTKDAIHIVTEHERVIGFLRHVRDIDFDHFSLDELIDRNCLLAFVHTSMPDVIRAVESKDADVAIIMGVVGSDKGDDVVGVITHREMFAATHQSAALLH